MSFELLLNGLAIILAVAGVWILMRAQRIRFDDPPIKEPTDESKIDS